MQDLQRQQNCCKSVLALLPKRILQLCCYLTKSVHVRAAVAHTMRNVLHAVGMQNVQGCSIAHCAAQSVHEEGLQALCTAAFLQVIQGGTSSMAGALWCRSALNMSFTMRQGSGLGHTAMRYAHALFNRAHSALLPALPVFNTTLPSAACPSVGRCSLKSFVPMTLLRLSLCTKLSSKGDSCLL